MIARVNGHALGGGTGLVACADIASPRPTRVFGFTEVRLGLIPATISPYVLRAIGPGARPRAVHQRPPLRRRPRRCDSASCTRSSSRDELRRRGGRARLADLLRGGPVAIAEAKRADRATPPRRWRCPTWPSGSAAARAGAEGQEGLAAFLEKREPAMGADPAHPDRQPRRDRGARDPRLPRARHRAGRASYEPDERGALHVELADDGASRSRRYLDADALVARPRPRGADAVHPGYGFLAENADFAEAVARGRPALGRPAAARRCAPLGDKIEARRLAEAAGVPVVPGYAGVDLDDDTLLAEAPRLGTRCS